MKGGDRDVVKLSLGGGQPTLNVFPEGQEGEILTLVCPFPLLALEVPVEVTLPGPEGKAVAATIRRVAVDHSGSDGVPRFRLQVQLPPSAGSNANAIAATSDEAHHDMSAAGREEIRLPKGDDDIPIYWDTRDLVDRANPEPNGTLPLHPVTKDTPIDAGRDDPAPPQEHKVGMSSWSGLPAHQREASGKSSTQSWAGWPSGAASDRPGRRPAEGETATRVEPQHRVRTSAPELHGGADPVWAEQLAVLSSTPPPPQRRGSQWAVKTAAALALVFSVAALGVTMYEPVIGWLNPLLGKGSWAEWIDQNPNENQDKGPFLGAVPSGSEAVPSPAPAESSLALASGHDRTGRGQSGTAPAVGQERPTGGATPAMGNWATGNRTNPAAGAQKPNVEGPSGGEADVDTTGLDSQDAVAEGELARLDTDSEESEVKTARILLRTQWPATTARAYRLTNPLGIVVDIPGGQPAEGARWVDTSHERIRSVRVIERRNGVRFVIYLNDDFIPRYQVGYGQSGVSVVVMGPDPRHET